MPTKTIPMQKFEEGALVDHPLTYTETGFEPDGPPDEEDAGYEERPHAEAHDLAFTSFVLPGEKDPETGETHDALWSMTLREGVTREEVESLLEVMMGTAALVHSWGGRFVTSQKLYSVGTVEAPVSGGSTDVATVPVQTPMAMAQPGGLPVGAQAPVGIGVPPQAAAPDMTPIVFAIEWVDVLMPKDPTKEQKPYARLGGPDQPNGVYVTWPKLKEFGISLGPHSALGKHPLVKGYEAVASRDPKKPQFPNRVEAIRPIS